MDIYKKFAQAFFCLFNEGGGVEAKRHNKIFLKESGGENPPQSSLLTGGQDFAKDESWEGGWFGGVGGFCGVDVRLVKN